MKKQYLVAVFSVLLVTCVLFSCSQNPEQNPLIQEKFQQITDLAERVDRLRGQVKDLDAELLKINDDMTTLKKMPRTEGASPTEVEGLKSEVKQLNEEITRLRSELSKMKKEMSETKSMVQSLPEKSVQKTITEKTDTSESTSEPESEPDQEKKGQYYTVKKGDTLDSIAEKFNTSASKIRSENHLPEGRKPIPGIRLYIIPGTE